MSDAEDPNSAPSTPGDPGAGSGAGAGAGAGAGGTTGPDSGAGADRAGSTATATMEAPEASGEPDLAGAPDEAGAEAVDAGTYELLRARLVGHARELAQRANALNARRLEHFGSTQLEALAAERVRTENNCVPRDIAATGEHLLFGYNVFIGLRTETAVDDVFALYRLDQTDDAFQLEAVAADDDANWLADERFQSDFRELYTYYRQARLLQLRRRNDLLLMVFQIGEQLDDLRVFQWSVRPGAPPRYVDNRGEREHTFPPNQDFEWTVAGREHHVAGVNPHLNILDTLFIELRGGHLTLKIEDNTEGGAGILREPIDEADQSLADADVAYARVGALILVMVRPYREHQWRHFVFNTRTHSVDRIDAIGQACQQLPEDHGIIYPGGYYLMNGETKTFASDIDDMIFVEAIRSPNGEDVLYAFHKVDDGRSILLSYNLIRKEVANPITCHGYSLFADGTLVIFQAANDEPTRVHPMQIWRTPYMSDEFFAGRPVGQGFFDTVGNAELVRAISDALALSRLVDDSAPSRAVYDEMSVTTTRLLDSYHWLDDDETGDLAGAVRQIGATGALVLDEFERAEEMRARARNAVGESDEQLTALYRDLAASPPDTAQGYVDTLAQLRRHQGHLVSLRELRYADRARIDALEAQLEAEFAQLATRAIEFLGAPDAFTPYQDRLADLARQAEAVDAVADCEPLTEELDTTAAGLEVLTDVVGSLEMGDARIRTGILEQISSVLGALNRARALLEGRRTELAGREAIAEFGAEYLLFEQAVTAALAAAGTPEGCDEQLANLVLRLESLDGRFGEFEDFGERLATKREDVYEAFSTRKQALLDDRQRRAERLVAAGERLLEAIGRRTETFGSLDDINTFYAGDQLVGRLRTITDQLRELGDAVRADELDGKRKASREDATRSLRDRADLYEDGDQVIRFGRHRFSVNTQTVDLTMVPSGEGMDLLLTGTDYRQPITDDDFLEVTRDHWQQLLPSEDERVARAEFLATSILAAAESGRGEWTLARLHEAAAGGHDELLELVRHEAESRYDEGYERGVHDHDAALLLEKLLHLYDTAGLLRFTTEARAAALRFWAFGPAVDDQAAWARQARSLGRLRDRFGEADAMAGLAKDLRDALEAWHHDAGLALDPEVAGRAGEYLAEELARAEPPRFVVSAAGVELRDGLLDSLDDADQRRQLLADLGEPDAAPTDPDARPEPAEIRDRWRLAQAWIDGYLSRLAGSDADAHERLAPRAAEATALLVVGKQVDHETSTALTGLRVEGLLSTHPRISGRTLELDLAELLARTDGFRRVTVPGFRAYQRRRHEMLEGERRRLRLSEFEPTVMSAFVRNGLIDQVYLRLIGDNLAKQLGTVGDDRRTDQSGLLLLISPPGYGKTTLMEYVANRLGLVFVKINGPALGHGVTSVDPAEAPDATSRQELEKLNFGLEMGNNVLLYLDDIQHTNPELLQKFISLCDAQRRMEGVWEGRTRTYDMRGKRFAVCMAGNPYTESGEVFRIPDMLANRADTWNLGDVLSGNQELFELSYLENSLTSNPTLAPLTSHPLSDVRLLVRMARGEPVPSDQLEHPWSATELEAMLAVLRKLLRVQEILLAVNGQYIASASQADEYRTEPLFQLQGSYRNMNKLAEKIVPVMNDKELEDLIDDHYRGEAQTLTSGTEWNLLRLRELRGVLTAEEHERVDDIRRTYARNQALGGDAEDPMVRMVAGLGAIAEAVGEAASREVEPPVVNVNVPPADAPDINVNMPPAEAPVVNVHVPAAEAPVVRVAVPVAEPPVIHVHGPAGAPPSTGAAPPPAARSTAGIAPRSSETEAPTTPGPAGPDSPTPRRPSETEDPITRGGPAAHGATTSDPATGGDDSMAGAHRAGAPPDPSLFGRRFFAAYLADEDLDFYWEVGEDGWAIRQLEVQRASGTPVAASTLDEWRNRGHEGPLGETGQTADFTHAALDPTDPKVQTRPISGTDFEQRWDTARRTLGLPPTNP